MDAGDVVRYTPEHWEWLVRAGKTVKPILGEDNMRRSWMGLVLEKDSDNGVLVVEWYKGIPFPRDKKMRNPTSHFIENLEMAT